ncbi:hypothetical protein C8A05DRAFT_12170 [Staphylotrichum tortipilum]|uniref:Uncharacterized protein n=1 Tax=Staphylotrichum tortipilum TaxID=2831512 RepID=A0AAN6RX58_9PEZI|nr:hypothetical protein C8A05DRAFT_12170 [Staphylotrichum longicolle]
MASFDTSEFDDETSAPGSFGSLRPSATRTQNFGPLTTVFTAPSGCDACFASSGSDASVCTAYFEDCQGLRSCVPRSSPWQQWDYYSPRLSCPSGWTTATVVSASMTNPIRAREVLSRMAPGETAAFCCPS